jgi:6-phosphogluconolactonase
MTQFWIGGYAADMGGDASGIGVLEGDDGREPTTLAYRGIAAAVESPSWLAKHPSLDVVYAALEGAGTVQAFVRNGEATLAPLGAPAPAGEDVCNVAVAPCGAYLVASCYSDGRVVRIGLDSVGRLGAPKISDAATDPYGADGVEPAVDLHASAFMVEPAPAAPSSGLLLFDDLLGMNAPAPEPEAPVAVEEQGRRSHAHAAAFLPDGRIATTDLGFDQVRIWRVTAQGLTQDHRVVLPHGVGPRHMVVHPSGHLHVVTEYSGEVFTLAAGEDGYWGAISAVAVAPGMQEGLDFPSEISRSRDGATLYVSVRGTNTVAALRVRGSGESIEPFALAESGVDWPRHHLVHDGALLVAGQRSNDISVLDLDDRTGAPRGIRHRAAAPSPTSILLA